MASENDQSLDIAVRMSSDLSGGQAATAQVKDTTEAAKRLQAIFDAQGKTTDEATEKVKDLGKAGEKAAKDVKSEVEKLTASHGDLRSMVRGLATQFPGLAHIAHLALHPVGLVVAGITGAFALWKHRVSELETAMAGMKLPDFSSKTISQVSAAAEAYEKLGTAIRDAAEHFDSVGAAHDRFTKKLQAELELQKQLLAAGKARDLAQLGARHAAGQMNDEEYRRQKEAIEGSYARAGLQGEQKTEADILADKEKKRSDLLASAERKRQEAAKIHLPSEADAAREQELEQQREENKKEAERALKEARARRGFVAEAEAHRGNLYWDNAFRWRYGYGTTYQEARGMEQMTADQAQDTIDRQNQHERQKVEREQARKRRQQLLQQAAAEAAEATEIEKSLPEERANLARKQAGQRQAAAMEDQARQAATYAEEAKTPLGQIIGQSARGQPSATAALSQAIDRSGYNSEAVLRDLHAAILKRDDSFQRLMHQIIDSLDHHAHQIADTYNNIQ